MALFSFPKYTERSYPFSKEMILCVDHYEDKDGNVFLSVKDPTKFRFVRGIMSESNVKKFAHYPELLPLEIEEEERDPDISNLERDIFSAVYDNDCVKFMRCVARVGHDEKMLQRIYGWLMSKEKFTKRDLALLKRIEGASSIYNVFDY